MATVSNSLKTISKQINIYMRRHPFVLSSTETFTTSQRRAFLRDVYDYARALGLGKKESKQQVIRAREMCGEDDYDTDVTALENEIDDSETIFTTLQMPDYSRSGSMAPAVPIIRATKETALATGHEVHSTSDGGGIPPQKRKRPAAAQDGVVSGSLHTVPRATAVKRATSHRPRGRPPKQLPQNNADTPSGVGRNPQRSGKPSNLSQQAFIQPEEERELVPRTKRVPMRIVASIEQDSDDPGTKADKKQATSHQNGAVTKSASLPATSFDSKNIDNAAQNFVPPEVAAFSDDDQDAS